MAKADELVKYVTEQFVIYMETPREVRKQTKASIRQSREQWQYRWFGMLPIAARMWVDGMRWNKKK
ncbi:YqzE family protein [Paenibacillus sp. H1-7]|uniref:YqzE family protein n=1 Tax=Paenibacillus sp. H1-7 TaxID=2282849 RepID=UPI001EF8E5A9|nr:YqzE family protein [Paenibacillus sp. H1-7]ULL19699.1 YqzE family protein [Paenibacillus sp. H1-7]